MTHMRKEKFWREHLRLQTGHMRNLDNRQEPVYLSVILDSNVIKYHGTTCPKPPGTMNIFLI